MKNIYILLLCAVTSVMAWADGRTSEEMLRIAQRQLGSNVTLAASNVTLAASNVTLAGSNVAGAKGLAVMPPAYVTYNASGGKGFVIVGADDRLPEVLGYSSRGSLTEETMVPALKDALTKLSLRLPYMKAAAVGGAKKNIAGGENIAAGGAQEGSTGGIEAVSPLLKTMWSQEDDYNGMCPWYTDKYGVTKHCPTGCTATALAQIIAHWGRQDSFPARGTGTISWRSIGYSDDQNPSVLDVVHDLSYDFSADSLDFKNMLDYYGLTYLGEDTVRKSSTDEEKKAVQNLMFACGALTEMNYGDQSGAQLTYLDRIEEHYGFGVGSRLLMHSYYPSAEWDSLLYDQLKKNYPIPYSAFTMDGSSGHSFIIDGIDTDGKVHVDWGWRGESNGFFALGYLYPDEQGTGGSDSHLSYNYKTQMIVDLAPSEKTPRSEYRCAGMYVDETTKKLCVSGMSAVSHCRKAKIAMRAEDANRNDTIISLSAEDIANLLPDTLQLLADTVVRGVVDVELPVSKFPDGDYNICLVTQDPGQQDWSLVRTPLNNYQSVEVRIQDGKITESAMNVKDYRLQYQLELSDSLIKLRRGVEASFNVALTNQSQYDLIDAITMLSVLAPDTTAYEDVASRAVNIQPGDTVRYSLSFTPWKMGMHKILFRCYRDDNTGQLLQSDTITVMVDANEANDTLGITLPEADELQVLASQSRVPAGIRSSYMRVALERTVEAEKWTLFVLPTALDGYYFGPDAERYKVTGCDITTNPITVRRETMADLDDFAANQMYLVKSPVNLSEIVALSPGVKTTVPSAGVLLICFTLDDFKDYPTSVKELKALNLTDAQQVYDLGGRLSKSVRSGIYIINGKKIFTK